MFSTKYEPLIAPINSSVLQHEIAKLPAEALLFARGEFEVYIAEAGQIPELLNEIGRLREKTFREVGEGTGKALDVDEFDQYYLNIFIWDVDKKAIVGGYRLGLGDQIFELAGISKFYIHSLFEIDEAFYPYLQKAIELGRSYIVQDYQKAYLPFFLLWRGILEVLIRNPKYQYLIGPVSISKYYSGVSKSLIVEFVKRFYFNKKLAKHFKPRTPYEPDLTPMSLRELLKNITGKKLKDLETFLNELEPDHIKVPVLLKQYTRLNAKFISFNIDPNFSDALDGLMILNLKKLPKETLRLLTEK